MKNRFILLIISAVLFSMFPMKVSAQNSTTKTAITISVDTVFTDKINIRAILIDKNKVWYAADKNRFGYYDIVKKNRIERKITNDSLQLEFRSIAQTSNSIFKIYFIFFNYR